MSRKYSEKFIEAKIKKIHELNEKTQTEHLDYPEFLDREENTWMKNQVREYVKNRVERAYVQGFWYGWTLKEGDPNKDS